MTAPNTITPVRMSLERRERIRRRLQWDECELTPIARELLTELDAVTRERDELEQHLETIRDEYDRAIADRK